MVGWQLGLLIFWITSKIGVILALLGWEDYGLEEFMFGLMGGASTRVAGESGTGATVIRVFLGQTRSTLTISAWIFRPLGAS